MYNRNVWSNEFIETFEVKGSLKKTTEFIWSFDVGKCKLQFGSEDPYVFDQPQPLETLTKRYSIDNELQKEWNDNICVKLQIVEDKAKMWYSVMQSKPWNYVSGHLIHKHGLYDTDGDIPESERVTWRPPDLREGDRWWFLDEAVAKMKTDEIPDDKRGSKAKK